MTRAALALAPLLLLLLLAAACAPAGTATLDPRVQVAAMNEADRLNAISLTATQEAKNVEFNHSQTETALPFAITALAQGSALTEIYVAGKAADATSTQTYRATDAARSAIAIPTSVAATGTALAVHAAQDEAELESVRSMNGLIAWAALGFIIGMGVGLYWLIGRARANLKRANNMAEAKPEVVGDMLVVPSPAGGWTVHKITPTTHQIAPPPEPEIEQRDIGGQVFGKARFIKYSQPVNEHEKIWRETLATALLIFKDYGFTSTNLCGKGKPFASASYWKDITDRLADNGLILKDNGDKTIRAGEWDEIISRVQDATRPLKLPKSLPPPLRSFAAQNVQ